MPQHPPTRPGGARTIIVVALAFALLMSAGVGLGAILFGTPRKKVYQRETPEQLLAAARDMVANNDAERLSELIIAENEHMRAALDRFGAALGRLQDLAATVNETFPKEVAELKAQAQSEAAKGRGAGFLRSMVMGGPRGPRRDQEPDSETDSAMNAVLQSLAADPYGWLTDNEQRLGFTTIDDERVALTFDGKPVLAPIGLVLQKRDGQWGMVAPMRLPMLARYMPQTPEEYAIWGSLFQIADNAISDLDADVRAGKVASLDGLSHAAGQKAFVPMGMAMIAYERAMADRRRRAREAAPTPPAQPPSQGG